MKEVILVLIGILTMVSTSISEIKNSVVAIINLDGRVVEADPGLNNLMVYISVSHVSEIERIFVAVGEQAGASDILKKEYRVYDRYGKFYVSAQGTESEIIKNEISIKVPIEKTTGLKQKVLTVYIQDRNGNYSSKKHVAL